MEEEAADLTDATDCYGSVSIRRIGQICGLLFPHLACLDLDKAPKKRFSERSTPLRLSPTGTGGAR